MKYKHLTYAQRCKVSAFILVSDYMKDEENPKKFWPNELINSKKQSVSLYIRINTFGGYSTGPKLMNNWIFRKPPCIFTWDSETHH